MIVRYDARLVLPPDRDCLELYLIATDDRGARFHGVAHESDIRFTQHESNGQMRPLLSLQGRLGHAAGSKPDELFTAIADEVRSVQGEPSSAEIRGRLAALERHLEDMRALVWKEGRP
jgi:hypothetical protein